MTLLPRMLLAQQGSDAKVPAEDFRLALAGLITPGPGTAVAALSGVLAGSGSSGYGCDVTSPSASTLSVAAGNFVIQRSSTNGGAYIGTIDAVTNVTITGLPASGNFKAGYLLLHAYDEAYGDTQDGAQLEVLLGASATTPATALYPSIPSNCLVLAGFTVTSAGAVTFTSSATRVVARGGIIPVVAGDNVGGDYVGQYRDEPTLGFQRWSGVAWYRPHPVYWGSGTSFPSAPQTGDTYLHTGLGVLMRYNGSNWRATEEAQVASAAGRNAISSGYAGLLYPGFRVRQTDVNYAFEWDPASTRWTKVPGMPAVLYSSLGVTTGFFAPNFNGVAVSTGPVPAHSPGPLRLTATVLVRVPVANGQVAGFLQMALGSSTSTVGLSYRFMTENVTGVLWMALEGTTYSDGTAKTLFLNATSDAGNSDNWMSRYQNWQVTQL